MKALFFFLLGNMAAMLYFSHLYWQLRRLAKGRRSARLWSFAFRFAILGISFGMLFAWDASMAIYAVAGMVTGRLGTQYLAKMKWRL